jgi:hypothetical protein
MAVLTLRIGEVSSVQSQINTSKRGCCCQLLQKILVALIRQHTHKGLESIHLAARHGNALICIGTKEAADSKHQKVGSVTAAD